MKVAILTITNGYNYGNRLQNYACQNVLEKLGINVETVKNVTNQMITSNKLDLRLKEIISVLYGNFIPLNINKFNGVLRVKQFNEFTDKYIKQSKYKISNKNIPSGIENEYDYFVCGSDQVWNPNFKFNSEVDFITFASKHKRIAYAPSFGVSEISDEIKPRYKKYINDMAYLSVREDAGADIIKKLTGRDSEVLVDPTMMLSKEEWIKISKKPKGFESKNYILTYFLGEKENETEKRIQEIAKHENLEIINLMDKNNKHIYSAGPSEFLYLINNAKLMCTDSFHGIVFSIIMKTAFIIFNRKDNLISMNSRIDTLSSKFNIYDRLSTNLNDNNLMDMDFDEINIALEKEKNKAKKYLEKALQLKGEKVEA